jgi:hypothetical protein
VSRYHFNPTEETFRLVRDWPGLWVIADGGVIAQNPSPIGGTWAYRIVRDGEVLSSDSGAMKPMFGPVSNNVAELYAVLRGIKEAAEKWDAAMLQGLNVASDSNVTLTRLTSAASRWEGVPVDLRRWAIGYMPRIDVAVLLDGHPTTLHLSCGAGKRGRPVSEHNVWCDKAATAAGQAFLQGTRLADPEPVATVTP